MMVEIFGFYHSLEILKIIFASDISFKEIQPTLVWSSVKEIHHLVSIKAITCEGPQISLFSNVKGLDFL